MNRFALTYRSSLLNMGLPKLMSNIPVLHNLNLASIGDYVDSRSSGGQEDVPAAFANTFAPAAIGIQSMNN